MAGLMTKTLRRLMPEGKAWRGTVLLQDGLSVSLDDARSFLTGIVDEARPETAEDFIDEWLELLGISMAESSTLGQKRKTAEAVFVSVGGQSVDYLNSRLRDAYPNAYIDEADSSDTGTAGVGECGDASCESEVAFTLFYYVRGFVPFSRDVNSVKALLTRIAPLHLVPVYEVRGVYDGDVARCGVGSIGRAITGRRETAWSETDGEVGRSGVGVTGIAITGRIPA